MIPKSAKVPKQVTRTFYAFYGVVSFLRSGMRKYKMRSYAVDFA